MTFTLVDEAPDCIGSRQDEAIERTSHAGATPALRQALANARRGLPSAWWNAARAMRASRA